MCNLAPSLAVTPFPSVTLDVSLSLSEQSLCWWVFLLLSAFRQWCRGKKNRESIWPNKSNPLRFVVFLEHGTVLTKLTTSPVIRSQTDNEATDRPLGTDSKHGYRSPHIRLHQTPKAHTILCQCGGLNVLQKTWRDKRFFWRCHNGFDVVTQVKVKASSSELFTLWSTNSFNAPTYPNNDLSVHELFVYIKRTVWNLIPKC